jgi:hypothetical protein
MIGGERMNKKILCVFVGVLFGIMFVAPVLAIGPIKSPEAKNKNVGTRFPNSVWFFTDHGLFQEFYDDGSIRYRLMRKNASICSIGGAVDGSSWDFTAVEGAVGAFMMLLTADSRWVYFDQTGMYNLLAEGFGMPPPMAATVSGTHPDGAYYKADMVGHYEN